MNHSLEEGLFVLQIPIHPPFDDFNNFKSNENNIISMILSCFAKNSGLKSGDFLIKNVGMWELSGQVAEKYYENRCFLMGDSAHSFPPAGLFH